MKNCCGTKFSEEAIAKLLSQHGFKRTSAMTKILLVIANTQTPVSVQDIQEAIGKKSCNPSTIFRTMTKFKEAGLIREVNLSEDFARFEFIKPSEPNHHHHHIRCRACGDIQLIQNCDIKPFERSLHSLGFQDLEHTIEFTGICKRCLR